MISITDIAKEEVIQEAFDHVYKRRKKRHHNDAIWHVSLHWDEIKPDIIERLLKGTYQLSPMKHYQIDDVGQVGIWCAEDAIVLKAIAIVLEKPIKETFDLENVAHVKGNGGLKQAVSKASAFCRSGNPFVYKTDVKDFYQTINHEVLINQLEKITNDEKLIKILTNYCERVDIVNG
ncbi:reverse transcriptase family protein, partial [Facilibium subflavum]|uniref:hypothetical protein n=1 Tax=Facilibium subflavum TaxID=2219058 RepID=UPI001AACA95C